MIAGLVGVFCGIDGGFGSRLFVICCAMGASGLVFWTWLQWLGF